MDDSTALLFGVAAAVISAQTLRQVVRERAALFDAWVSPHDAMLLDRAAVFFLVPIGVLLHEVGHALATWQVGGEVLALRWYLFYGYVVPWGDFTALEGWWISLSGNVVSLALGLAALALLRLPMSPPWFYLTLAFGRVQTVYALVVYPLIGLAGRWGDFVTIYSAQGGVWAYVTALVHVVLLAGLWLAGRSPRVRAWLASRGVPSG